MCQGGHMGLGTPTFFLGGPGPPTFQFRILPNWVEVTPLVLGPLLK